MTIRVEGVSRWGLTTSFRAVGHRKGSKQLLTSVGLVRAGRTDRAPSGSVQPTNNGLEFFRAKFEFDRTKELRA
jgi:hypothetical protein